jgi:broad specificity phosphatase PhoE
LTLLHLIRHGATALNPGHYQGRLDPPLDERGRRQAALLAGWLRDVPFDAVCTSDLSRARQTAEALAAGRPLEVCPLPAFREQAYGPWEGLSFEEAAAQYPELWQRYHSGDVDTRLPGGESFRDVMERVRGGLEELRREYEGRTVALVSHVGCLRAVLSLVLELDPARRHMLHLDNTSWSVLELGPPPLLRRFNDTCHLDGHVG